MTASRRKRTEAVAHLLVRRGAEADPTGLGERFEQVRFVPEMERFLYRRRSRDAQPAPYENRFASIVTIEKPPDYSMGNYMDSLGAWTALTQRGETAEISPCPHSYLTDMAYDEATAEQVRSALSGQSNVVERKMMGGLKFMLNGNMLCSVIGRGGLLIRVGVKDREAVLKEPHVRPMKLGARTLAAFVLVDPAGYRTDAALRKWLQRGLDFLATLPMKAD